MAAPIPQHAPVCISVSFLFRSTGNTEALHPLPLPLIHALFVSFFLLGVAPHPNTSLPTMPCWPVLRHRRGVGGGGGRDRRGERDLVTLQFSALARCPCGSWILSQLSSVCSLFLQAPTPSGPWLPHHRPALRFPGSKGDRLQD